MIYSELRRQIESATASVDTEFTAEIDSCIRRAEDYIGMMIRIPNYTTTAAFTIAGSVSTVPAPTGFVSEDWISVPGYGILEKKSTSFIQEAYPDSSETGPPRFFALKDDKTFLIGPTPDQTYNGTIQFFSKWPSLVDLGHNNATNTQQTFISNNFGPALYHMAMCEAFMWMQDMEAAAAEQQKAETGLPLINKFATGKAKTQTSEKGNAANQANDSE